VNLEAAAAIGALCILLGAVLYIGARLLFAAEISKERTAYPRLRMTGLGLILTALLVITLLGGFSMQYLGSQSAFGRALAPRLTI
jgi:predicted transporter